MMLTSMLERQQEENLRQQFTLSAEEKDRLSRPINGFDSHCYLDRTVRVLNLQTSSLQAICNQVPAEESYKIQLTGCVGVFCDPDTIPSAVQLSNWIEQGVVPVLGIHPKYSISDRQLHRFGVLLDQGSHRPEKYLNLEGFLEKSLKIKSALKSTGKSLKSLEKSLNSTIFCRT